MDAAEGLAGVRRRNDGSAPSGRRLPSSGELPVARVLDVVAAATAPRLRLRRQLLSAPWSGPHTHRGSFRNGGHHRVWTHRRRLR